MNKQEINNFPKITVKNVFYGEKYGGDDCYAEIYKNKELVGKVFRNGYSNEVRSVDLRLSAKDNDDSRALIIIRTKNYH